MNKITKNIIIVSIISVLVVVSVVMGAFLNGGTQFAMSFLGLETTKPTETETGDAGSGNYEYAAVPEKMSAVWLEIGDIGLSEEMTVDSAVKATEKTADDIADKGFNAVFVDADENSISEFQCSDGKTDILSVLLKKFESSNIYTAVIFSESGSYADCSDRLIGLIQKYNFSCVVLAGDMAKADNVKLVSADIGSSDRAITVAVAADSTSAQEICGLLSIGRGDFFVSIPQSAADAGEDYLKELEDFDSFSRKNGFKFAAGVRVDILRGELESAETASLVIDQLALCDELDGCTGAVLFKYSDFMKDDAVGALVLKYMSDKNREDLEKDFELKNFSGNTKTTNESKITFAGSSSPLYDLELNGEKVERESNGDFSFEVSLKIGKNVFEFSHKGIDYKYTVTYEVKLLESVSPVGEVNAPGGSSLTITATALKGASVYATINGQKINLTKLTNVVQDENGTVLDDSSDFAVFSGKYTLPAGKTKEQALGRIKVYASYNGLSESLSGASVSVSAEIPVPEPEPDTKPETSKPESGGETTSPGGSTEPGTTEKPTESQGTTGSFDPSEMLTPYKYAGVSGKSKMCEITSLCETMPADVLDDCVPYSSPLPAGTFDYISSEYTYGGVKYYRLASGKNILASKAKVISSGYNLPQNRVTVVSSSSDSEKTQIKLGLLWKGPFNISVKNQSYIPQSQANGGSLYSVSSFDGKYLELVFYHAGTVSGKVDVTGSKIISKAEWISNTSAKTLTLRMTLKTPGKFYGFDIDYTSDGCLTLSVKAKPSTSLKGSVIMIDAGHGGNDSGAICAYNPDSSRKYEKQINLLIAQKIKSKLEAQGATVIMTRTGDSYLSLDERVSLTRSKNPDMFISVHCDSSESATPMGTSAYYYQAYSFPLASAVHKRIVSAYKSDMYYGASSSVQSKIDRGTNMYPFRVTRVEECPAILVEYGFVSNINECKLLWTSSVQDKLAQATVDGIKDYISSS